MVDIAQEPFFPLTEDNRAAVVVVASLVFLIYAVVGLSIKLLIRLNITSMGPSDIILIASTLLYIAQTACVVVASHNGLGQHQELITADQFAVYSKSMYSSRILALVVNGGAKISVCLLIRQINGYGLTHRMNLGLGILIVLWTVSGLLATMFQCPLPRPWLAVSSGQCPALDPVYYYNGVLNILTDVGLCALPVFMMWDVQTSRHKKWIVVSLFGARIIVPAATIPSLSSVVPLFDDHADSTWHAVTSTVWFQISLGLSILTACIPSLKGVIDSLMGATAAAMIQGPYELRTGKDRSGLTATKLSSAKQSYIRSGDNGSGGRAGLGSSSGPRRKLMQLGNWGGDVEHQTTIRNESPPRSESVRKLTDGVIVVQDEIEVAYDSKNAGRSSRGNESHGSSEARYRLSGTP